MIHHLPAHLRLVKAWKNGGGVTRDILCAPSDADLDGFDWRVSLAEITKPGPFSSFINIDRHVIVLEGEARLEFDTHSQNLKAGEPGHDFSGEATVMGVPLTQTVTDLNIMTRRHRYRTEVTRLKAGAAFRLTSPTALLVSLATQDCAGHDLAYLDALYFESEVGRDFNLSDAAILIEIFSDETRA